MSLKIAEQKLKEILILFHNLTKIRLVIYDEDFCKVMAYPEEKCFFCRQVRSVPDLREKCLASDKGALLLCREKKDLIFYNCHAGLLECVAPIKNDNRIIGYVMFGQITDQKDKCKLQETAGAICKRFHLSCDITDIKYKSQRQIMAAAKLLEICTDYILLKQLLEAEDNFILTKAKEYIESHLSEQIEIEDLCWFTKTSRTKLYEMFSKHCGMGIAAYIKNMRLEKACSLLKNSTWSIAEVSASVGFDDYNYFSRVFKHKYGMSPRNYRK